MSAELEALKRRLEGKIALAKTYSDMHALLSLRDAERLLAALERIQTALDALAAAREENANLRGLLLRAGTALTAERAGGEPDWTVGSDIDAVLPQGSAWEDGGNA